MNLDTKRSENTAKVDTDATSAMPSISPSKEGEIQLLGAFDVRAAIFALFPTK
jgi:hypothetical protein